MTMRFRMALCGALGGVLVLAACETDRTTAFNPVGSPVFDFAVGPAAAGLPGGRADREIVRTLVDTIEVDSTPAGVVSTALTRDTLALDSAVTVVAHGLRALAGGAVYQAWAIGTDGVSVPVFGRVVEYFSFDTGEVDPISGDPIFGVDSTEMIASGGGTYAGSDDPLVDSVSFTVIPSDAMNTVNPFENTVNAVFVSLESGAATTPGPAQFLWHRVGLATGGTVSNVTVTADTVVVSTNTDPTIPDTIEVTRRARSTVNGSGALAFGHFGGRDVISVSSPSDYVFPVAGAGQGGIRGDELSVDYRELARPPVGFYYRAFLVDADGNAVLVDTLRSAWSADADVSRLNMLNADVDDLLPGIAGQDIRAAQTRNCRSGSGVVNCQNTLGVSATDTWVPWPTFQLVLEPKGGTAGMGRSVTHAGDLPEEVRQ